MKNILITIAAVLLAATYAKAEYEVVADTTITYNGHSVTITDDSLNNDQQGNSIYETTYEEWTISESFSLPLFNMTSKESKHFKITKRSSFESHVPGFYVGFNNVIDAQDDNFDCNMARSVEIGFDCIDHTAVVNQNIAFTLGVGLNWRNFKINDDYWMQKRGGYLPVEKFGETEATKGGELDYSKVRIFGFNIPVVMEIEQKGGRGFFGYVGPQMDIRVARRVKNIYTDANGNQQTHTDKHLRTIPIGLDLVGAIGYRDWAIYAKYSPTKLFEDGRGPINQALTVGIKWCW